MFKELKSITKKGIKFIILMIAFIYIVSPIDFIPTNPIDDIFVALISFLIVFSDIGEKELGILSDAYNIKTSLFDKKVK